MGVKFIDPLDGLTSTNTLAYDDVDNTKRHFNFDNLYYTLAANRILPKDRTRRYNNISRFGFIPVFDTEQVVKEYLFFTKPDLHIYSNNVKNKNSEYVYGSDYKYDSTLNSDLASIPFFVDASERNGDALKQLQYSVKDSNGVKNPFMYLLSNCVSSKLDLPGISAESKESTANIMGTTIQYRGHSYKSDNGYDFTLSFTDTAYLELYTLLKAYDEYMRLLKVGEVKPMKRYIENRIISEQFSIYKFLIGEDGETILFYAKLTGCYFTDVPRSDMSDPGNEGFKYSVSFHAQFVEDSNPLILSEFNRITPGKYSTTYASVYDNTNNVVDNTWVRWPKIVPVGNEDKQVKRRGTTYDYRLKWIK